MSSEKIGRLEEGRVDKAIDDSGSDKVKAMLNKQDQMIDALNALLAKLDADAVGGADYVAVIGALSKVKLNI